MSSAPKAEDKVAEPPDLTVQDESASAPPADLSIEGLGRTVRRVAGNSIVYFIGEGGVRAATILVIPLYTHALTPKDYGILAVASTSALVITMLLSFELQSAVGRFTQEIDSEEERRRLYGTLLGFLLTVGLASTVALDVMGQLGYLNFFRAVPYNPYLRYALWTGYLTVFPQLPISLYAVRGEPRKVLQLRFLTIFVQVGSGIILIVVLHQGVVGALQAILLGAIVSAVVSVIAMIRNSSARFSRRLLTMSLAFCLPIIPHSLSNWILQLSDRIVLQRYVNDSQLGLYQLGYTVGGASVIFVNAVQAAATPIFVPRLRDEHARSQIPPIGTYMLVVLTFLCIGVAVFGGTMLRLVTPATYAGATVIVPWVAASYVFVSIYLLLSVGSWYSMRTMWIATGTAIAAVVNVGATFLFGSFFGIVGGGISTLIGFAFLALIQGYIAHRLYPIPWEYGRWAKLLLVAGGCLAAGLLIGGSVTVFSLGLRACVMLIGFPLGLQLLAFWTAAERRGLADARKGLSSALALRLKRLSPGTRRV